MVIRFSKIIPAAAVGAAAFTVFSAGATAYFPPVNGGGNQVKSVPVTPQTPVVPVVPPVNPPVVKTKTTHKCTVPPTVPPVNPSAVPEPATIVTGLFGLSMVGIAALRKKLKKSKDESKAE